MGQALQVNVQTGERAVLEYTPEPVAPQTFPLIAASPRQIRQALTLAELREQVETAVAAGDQDLKDWWAFSTVFEENHPQVVAMAGALGVTAEALHTLFVRAASL